MVFSMRLQYGCLKGGAGGGPPEHTNYGQLRVVGFVGRNESGKVLMPWRTVFVNSSLGKRTSKASSS